MGWKDHLRKAIELTGSQVALGAKIGCSQAKISWLLISADNISAEDAVAIERATDGRVSRRDLRPDMWPMSGAA